VSFLQCGVMTCGAVRGNFDHTIKTLSSRACLYIKKEYTYNKAFLIHIQVFDVSDVFA